MGRSGFFHALICLIAILATAAPASAATPEITLDRIPEYAPDRIMVAFQPGTAGHTARSVHAQNGGRVLKTFSFIGVDVVAVPKGSVQGKLALYSRNPNVLFAEPSYYKVMIIPDEGQESALPSGIGDYWKEQWGMHNTGSFSNYVIDPFTGVYSPVPVLTDADADIDAPEAWDVFRQDCPDEGSCPPSRIAILDSGVECQHADISCDMDVNVLVAGNHVENVPDGDLLGHGTHVAGIAAATNNNDIGISGVGWSSVIGSFKVCYAALIEGQVVGLCDSAAIVDALGRAIDNNYDVVNMSFGGYYPEGPPETEVLALDAAAAAGVVLVSSAGNNYAREGCTFPATHTSVISVGSTDFHDNLSSFSNFGDCVSVLAPGTNIFSTFPAAACGLLESDPQGCYTWLDGTSMAGPVVAGLAGMIRTMMPEASAVAVRNLIESNSEVFGARDQNMLAWSQSGRINADTTLREVVTTPPPPPTEKMYVWDIDMYKRGPNLSIDVTIKWDSNRNDTIEASDLPAEGVVLSVELCASPSTVGATCNFTTTAVATDANGQANYRARSATGSYVFTVTDMSHDRYEWLATMPDNNSEIFP